MSLFVFFSFGLLGVERVGRVGGLGGLGWNEHVDVRVMGRKTIKRDQKASCLASLCTF